MNEVELDELLNNGEQYLGQHLNVKNKYGKVNKYRFEKIGSSRSFSYKGDGNEKFSTPNGLLKSENNLELWKPLPQIIKEFEKQEKET